MLIDCDKISIGTTGSDFIVVEDDNSIGIFVSKSGTVSFKEVPEVFNFEIDSNSTFSPINQESRIKNLQN